MACCAYLFCYHEYRIAVAVIAYFFYILEVTGGLALVPHCLAAPAVEPCPACSKSELQRFFVHIRPEIEVLYEGYEVIATGPTWQARVRGRRILSARVSVRFLFYRFPYYFTIIFRYIKKVRTHERAARFMLPENVILS